MGKKFDNHQEIKIGISYNKRNGGAAADSVKKIIKLNNLDAIEIDYRVILPEEYVREDLFLNEELFKTILVFAKTQATLLLKNIDGLIIPGNSSSIDPRFYNQPQIAGHTTDLSRAIAEMALVHVAMQRGIPILAICGGHQIINVYLGGTLKELSDEEIDEQGYMCYSDVDFNLESELAKIFFDNQKNRNRLKDFDFFTFPFFGAHKEAIHTLGNKMLVNNLSLISPVAWASHPTYTIEALESNFGSPLYSTQFHPETGTVGMYSIVYKAISYKPESAASVEINSKIFVAFGDAAISYHLKRGLLFSAKKSNYSDAIAGEASSKTDQKEIKISTSSLSVYSLFMESQIKPQNLNECKDKPILECAKPATLI